MCISNTRKGRVLSVPFPWVILFCLFRYSCCWNSGSICQQNISTGNKHDIEEYLHITFGSLLMWNKILKVRNMLSGISNIWYLNTYQSSDKLILTLFFKNLVKTGFSLRNILLNCISVYFTRKTGIIRFWKSYFCSKKFFQYLFWRRFQKLWFVSD